MRPKNQEKSSSYIIVLRARSVIRSPLGSAVKSLYVLGLLYFPECRDSGWLRFVGGRRNTAIALCTLCGHSYVVCVCVGSRVALDAFINS